MPKLITTNANAEVFLSPIRQRTKQAKLEAMKYMSKYGQQCAYNYNAWTESGRVGQLSSKNETVNKQARRQ